jgi:DNA helicase-2/ATP-dependent DNA helicase PcrA
MVPKSAPPAVSPRFGAAPPNTKGVAPKSKAFGQGSMVNHPKYGRGTIMRVEGDGDDAKLTISFPGYGLKKIIKKYAGIKTDE